MPRTYFDGHILKKGKFITPINQLDNVELSSWSRNRMPEYLWIGCLLNGKDRTTSMEACAKIMKKLYAISPETTHPRFSCILNLERETQLKFYQSIINEFEVEPFLPLTLLYTTTKAPIFSYVFSQHNIEPKELASKLLSVVKKSYPSHAELATDIRFFIVYYSLISGRLKATNGVSFEEMKIYPYILHSNEQMKMLRPMVRSMEGAMGTLDGDDEQIAFIKEFWEGIGRMTDCELSCISYEPEETDGTAYIEKAQEQMQFYIDVYIASRNRDTKMLVLLGIASFALKRIQELVSHNLYNTISGRGITRCAIECFIMMKYLCHIETEKPNIWDDFQEYGMGQYKLVHERITADGVDMLSSHLNLDYIKIIISQDKDPMFVNMDTSYFDKKGVREKSETVGEKALWSHYYDYDSAFEHGLWGAIRESVMLECNAVAHQYHCVPDVRNLTKLKSVWLDCKMVMTKILAFLEGIYGIPAGFSLEEKADE